MTKLEKIESLKTAMTVKERDDKTEFTCFTDTGPKELKDLFLENFEVRDQDYQIFSKACDLLTKIYADEIKEDDIDDEIYERANECGSVYTSDRLALLNMWNQSEITDHIVPGLDIATACAIWFDGEVTHACFIIRKWINEDN